jgi:hypothetical protein
MKKKQRPQTADHRPPTGRDATPSRPPLDAHAQREVAATVARMINKAPADLLRAIVRTNNELERAESALEDLHNKLRGQLRELARQAS